MNSYLILILIGILAIIVIVFLNKRSENFLTARQIEENVAMQTFKYVKLRDHSTLALIQQGNGPHTIILLHNSPVDMGVWNPLFQTVQRLGLQGVVTPTLIAYDMRGHGTAWLPIQEQYTDADPFNHQWTIEEFAQDCKQVYDQIIGSGKIKIGGAGFGGRVAQKFSLLFPELVEQVYLFQSSIRETPGVSDAIPLLSNWIRTNRLPSYLTQNKKDVDVQMCDWFFLRNCPNPQDTHVFEDKSPQYKLMYSLFRRSSATTFLETLKIGVTDNLEQEWIDIQNPQFKVYILAAVHDPAAPPNLMAETYSNIYNNNRELEMIFDVVDGKHGFTNIHPEYIASIICEEWEKIPKNRVSLRERQEIHVSGF